MLIIAIVWSLILIVGIFLIIKVASQPISKDTTIKLTKEEMDARPVMVADIPIQETDSEVGMCVIEAAELPKYKYYDFIPLPEDMQIHCQELCEQYHVGFAFFLAMMESESSFNVDAHGDSSNSIGLMQINKPNWDRYDLNASIPKDNVEIGIRMMSEYIIKYQEVDKVVMAYKGGESAMLKWVEEGTRLKACDDIVNSAMWWQERLDEYGR